VAGKEIIGERPGPGGLTYSPAVKKGGLLFISGLNAIDESGTLVAPGDIVGQTRAIYEKMGALLRAAGGSFADVVKTTDYIVDRTGYRETAAVRREFLGPDFPAATGVVVRELFGRGVLIEIDAVAVIGG
jgi:aminoacrylate peracid reductase